MGEYDKELMTLYARVYASAVSTGKDNKDAQRIASNALADFKRQFPRPDARNPSTY